MPSNLTRKTSSLTTDHFYTAIHERMATQEAITGNPRPTIREFAGTLAKFAIPPAAIALDAGCGGTASLAIACDHHGFGKVYAIDVNQDSLLRAQDIVKGSHAKAVRLLCGSLLSMPFADQSFDFAACVGVVHHTPNPEHAVRELARVLKVGGTLYITVYCFAGSLFESIVRTLRCMGQPIPFHRLHRFFQRSRIWNNFVLDHMYVPILWLYSAEEMRQVLVRNDFTVISEWTSDMDPFARYRRLGQWITGDGLMRVWLCEKRTHAAPAHITSAAGS
jgi:SAM-dependent methyltransferase